MAACTKRTHARVSDLRAWPLLSCRFFSGCHKLERMRNVLGDGDQGLWVRKTGCQRVLQGTTVDPVETKTALEQIDKVDLTSCNSSFLCR